MMGHFFFVEISMKMIEDDDLMISENPIPPKMEPSKIPSNPNLEHSKKVGGLSMFKV